MAPKRKAVGGTRAKAKKSTPKTRAKTPKTAPPAPVKEAAPEFETGQAFTAPPPSVPEPDAEATEAEGGQGEPETVHEPETVADWTAPPVVAPQQALPTPPQPPPTEKKVLGIPKVILLREPEFHYDEAGTRVVEIVGKCTETLFDGDGKPAGLCPNTRIIAPQDAFQVRRCVAHQKRANHKKIAARRKAVRAAERQAREQVSAEVAALVAR